MSSVATSLLCSSSPSSWPLLMSVCYRSLHSTCNKHQENCLVCVQTGWGTQMCICCALSHVYGLALCYFREVSVDAYSCPLFSLCYLFHHICLKLLYFFLCDSFFDLFRIFIYFIPCYEMKKNQIIINL